MHNYGYRPSLFVLFFAFVPDLADNCFEDSLRTVDEYKISNKPQVSKLERVHRTANVIGRVRQAVEIKGYASVDAFCTPLTLKQWPEMPLNTYSFSLCHTSEIEP
jgi:hypothetical protein